MGFIIALFAMRMSSAPGWRELRWFAGCAFLGAAFIAANTTTYLASSDAMVLLGSRFSLCFGALQTACWFLFFATQRGELTNVDRFFVGSGALLAPISLIPGVVLSNTIHERPVAWLGITYRDGLPTTFGSVIYGFHLVAIAFLVVRYAVRWSSGEQNAATYFLSTAVMLVCAIHDSLAGAGVLHGPYILEFALLAIVFSVGASLTTRFVASARALESSSRSLALAQEELVKRERLAALGELGAMVAHEVRNPLGVVFNALSGLRKAGPEGKDHDELLRIAQEEAERIRGIISALLEFARPRPILLAPASMGDVVKGAVEAARRALESSDDAVTVVIGEGADAVMCDEQLVRQAVINLVTNALQAPARHGPVRVMVDRSPRGESVIRVIDDGEGIAPDMRERIFTPFYSTRATGTGLGLAVVLRTAEVHGGNVELSATPGGGATFTMTFPKPAREGPTSPPSSARRKPAA